MNKEEFLKKIEVELKISKNSEYTIRNYLIANQTLLDFAKKSPEQLNSDDVKSYMAEKMICEVKGVAVANFEPKRNSIELNRYY